MYDIYIIQLRLTSTTLLLWTVISVDWGEMAADSVSPKLSFSILTRSRKAFTLCLNIKEKTDIN